MEQNKDQTSNAGHYTPNAAGRDGGIVSSSPEAQVNPPGKPQSGHGSATEPVAPGTAGAMSDEANRKKEGPDSDMATNADSNLSGDAGDD